LQNGIATARTSGIDRPKKKSQMDSKESDRPRNGLDELCTFGAVVNRNPDQVVQKKVLRVGPEVLAAEGRQLGVQIGH
jgi:hypothetical protein